MASTAPSSARSSAPSTGRLPMGFEDESSLPGADAKRKAMEEKAAAAKARQQAELQKKAAKAKAKRETPRSARKGKNGKPPTGRTKRKTGSGDGKSRSDGVSEPIRGDLEAEILDLLGPAEDGSPKSVEDLIREIRRLREANDSLDTAYKREHHENGNIRMKLSQSKKELEQQLSIYDTDIGKLRKRVSAMQDRVAVVTRLESGLVELCLEVRDRSADDFSENDKHNHGGTHGIGGGAGSMLLRHETSKRDLLKDCNNDVLVVLDRLRANLRIQLQFKQDYESELRSTLDRRRDAHLMEIKRLQKIIEELNHKLSRKEDRSKEQERRLSEVEDDKARVARECEAMVAAWRKKISDLEAQLHARDVKYKELEKKTNQKDMALKEADTKQLRIIQLENQVLQTQKKAERDLSRNRVAHRNEMSAMEVQLNLLRREASHRADAEKEAQRLKQDLASYQQNLKLARFEGAELRAESALRDAAQLKEILSGKSNELRKVKLKAERQAETIAKLKVEYNRLFKLAEKADRKGTGQRGGNGLESGDINDEHPIKGLSRETIKEIANRNVHYASYYKKKLAAQKKEVRALKSITKQWMMSDHKKTAALRVTRSATQRYEMEIESIQRHASNLEKKLEAAERSSLNARLRRSSSGTASSSDLKANLVALTSSSGNIENQHSSRSSVLSFAEKENAGQNSARIMGDLDSVKEDKQRVHNILLRADLLGLMNNEEEDKGVFSTDDYDVTGARRPMMKSASTTVLSTGKSSRRRLRPKSAGRTRGLRSSTGKGQKIAGRVRPQSASRARRNR